MQSPAASNGWGGGDGGVGGGCGGVGGCGGWGGGSGAMVKLLTNVCLHASTPVHRHLRSALAATPNSIDSSMTTYRRLEQPAILQRLPGSTLSRSRRSCRARTGMSGSIVHPGTRSAGQLWS
eukprot:5690640-Prymnesium_polylepis.1